LANVQLIERFRIWISESITLYFRIWIGYGVDEKVSDWIRIAKFPHPYTIAKYVIMSISNVKNYFLGSPKILIQLGCK